MTTREAITIIKTAIAEVEWNHPMDYTVAFEVAIKALEKLDNDSPKLDSGIDDLISRQAALDCFHDWIDKRGDVHTADEMPEYRAIEALPYSEHWEVAYERGYERGYKRGRREGEDNEAD